MSLKAKIEAVIYASEEPVTLVQLTGLLGEEAQLEMDALEEQQTSFELEDPADDADALNAETLSEPFEEGSDAPAAEAGGESEIVPEADAKGMAAEAKARERKLRTYFRELLDQLIADYANGDRGLEIREVAGGFRLATKPEYHDAVRGFVKQLKPPMKLTMQALETLAVVAYKQPVTSPEVSEIRGVDSSGVLGSLMARKLVTTAGRKQVIGRPILYKTTKDFLVRFGLKDVAELPSIEEFEKMAGELNDAVQEEIQMDALRGNHSDSATVDEANAAPEPTNTLHESVEDMLSDKSSRPEGAKHEPDLAAAHDVEPMADVHAAQADGVPDGDEPAS